MKKNILLVLITAIICIAGTVAAGTTINANDIIYDSTHTVKDKIDDLYTKANSCPHLTETTNVTTNYQQIIEKILSSKDNTYARCSMTIRFSN